ncbi:unnamed protein product, partial [Rotaria sordida]
TNPSDSEFTSDYTWSCHYQYNNIDIEINAQRKKNKMFLTLQQKPNTTLRKQTTIDMDEHIQIVGDKLKFNKQEKLDLSLNMLINGFKDVITNTSSGGNDNQLSSQQQQSLPPMMHDPPPPDHHPHMARSRPSAQWLLSYADRLSPCNLQHANSLYVTLNLFLFTYGSAIFRERSDIDIFKMLDDFNHYFVENRNQ